MNRSEPSQVLPPWATVGQDEVDKYYLLVCRECKPELPMPFPSPEERGKWAAEHTKGTGHDRWFVYDQPKEPVPLCPEAEKRAAMTDGEFWEHVLLGGPPPPAMLDYDPTEDPNFPTPEELELESKLDTLCPECGQTGACAYDAEGRPMIHVINEDDDGS